MCFCFFFWSGSKQINFLRIGETNLNNNIYDILYPSPAAFDLNLILLITGKKYEIVFQKISINFKDSNFNSNNFNSNNF